jgi:hypothetical protein
MVVVPPILLTAVNPNCVPDGDATFVLSLPLMATPEAPDAPIELHPKMFPLTNVAVPGV